MLPVIIPFQALILGVVTDIEQRCNVDCKIDLATLMPATASFDHSASNRSTVSKFMKAFREMVENSLRSVV